MTLVTVNSVVAQTKYTADFSTSPRFDYEGGQTYYKTRTTVNIGGVNYLIHNAINADFTWTGSAVSYNPYSGVGLLIEREDQQLFNFYGIDLNYTSVNTDLAHAPWLTVSYQGANGQAAPADAYNETSKNFSVSKPAGLAVKYVQLYFADVATLLLDNLIVGPASTTPTCFNPTIPTISATKTSICAGSSTILTIQSGSLNDATNWKWYSGSCGGTPVGTGSAIQVSPGSTTTYYVRGEGGCVTPGSCASQQITVNSPFFASLSNNGPLTCTRTSVTLTTTGGPQGATYTYSGGAQVNSTNPATATVSQAGPYSVTVTVPGGCVATASTSVSSNTAAPTATLSASPSATLTCAQTSLTLTAGGGGSSYAFNGPGVVSQSNNQAVVNRAGSYSVSVSSANGCSATATTTISQNTTAPTASLMSSGTLSCSQTSVTLTASPSGQTYTFSGPGVVSQNGNTATVNAGGLYSVTVLSGNGCSSVASTAVSQDNSAPVASLMSSGSLTCAITSVTLTASPSGQTYRFSGPGVVSQSGNTAVVNTAGTYSVTVVSGNGCSSVVTTSVAGDQSVPTVSITPTGATLTCTNPSATLTATGTGSFRWNTGAQTATITATSAGTYSVTVTGSNGCTATASTLVNSDQTPPSVSITPTSGTLTCASPTLTLTVNTSAPTLRWSTGQTTPSVTVNTAGTYSVTATGANGCSATSNSVLIESSQTTPSATLVASGGLSCAVTSVTLTANADSGLSYRFGSGATQVGNSNTATVNVAGTYSVTVTNTATGCTNTASVVVGQDNSQPTVSISPSSATLTCGLPTATLTANTSASGLIWSTGQTASSITVNVAGTYSVTVTSANGCQAVAQASVSGTTDAPSAPTLAAAPATTTSGQPITVTASGCSAGTITWIALGGTGQANGNTYTLTQPGNYTLSASCSLNSCTSSPSAPLALQIRPGGFAIIGVSMVNCQLVDAARGNYQVQFTPQYAGQTSDPISFSVVNELAATTAPAPYSLRLYTDNPTITLVATQAGNGEARFAYNWLASCQSGTSPNRPPTTTGIPNQTIVQGQAYQLQLTSYFTDPDGQALTFQASGLPAGLSLTGSVISGTPSQTGLVSVNVTAIDPGGLQVSTSFQLTVSPMPVMPPSGFAIVGVSTVSCQVIGAGERQLTFTPQYAGVSGQPISFSVVNERRPTTAPGPYTLRLYTDNPAITLSAQQGSAVSSYRYNWLAVCNPAGRVGLGEAESMLVVRVLGNPLTGEVVQVEVQGADGQPVQVSLTNLQGQLVSERSIQQAGQVEFLSLPVASQPAGLLVLRVSTPTQNQTLKVLKR